MKFLAHLNAHITPEWRKQYVRYEDLKMMLYEAQKECPDDIEDLASRRDYECFDTSFFEELDKELNKVNMFYSEKLAEARRKFSNLQAELSYAKSRTTEERINSGLRMRRLSIIHNTKQKVLELHARKVSDLKLAFSEFYLSLILLQNYQSLNFTGFRKILKKHDKQLYINDLEDGNRTKAMKRLRVPPLVDKQTPRTSFMMGFFAGMFVVLFATAIVTGYTAYSHYQSYWKPYLYMFRGMFCAILLIFLLGINTYGWRKHGVNHVLIFELDPRDHLTHQELLELSFMLGVLWCCGLIMFFMSFSLGIPEQLPPALLFFALLFFLINPVHSFKYKARFWFLGILKRIILAPYYPVGFSDFWLGDQLTSLPTMFLDMEYLFCFYLFKLNWVFQNEDEIGECSSYSTGIRIIIAVMPYWFRFAQCLRRYYDTKKASPHLVNAGKYSTAFFTYGFTAAVSIYKEHTHQLSIPLVILWIVAYIIYACYTLYWDLKMDWGLLHPSPGENKFLREEIVYPQKRFYYFAIVEDCMLRFTWIFSISCTVFGYMDSDIMSTITALLEIFRRFVWNFFRLENEHLNNCGEFRAVRDISVAPLDQDNQEVLCKMMDDENYIKNKRSPNYGAYASKSETKLLLEEDEDEFD